MTFVSAGHDDWIIFRDEVEGGISMPYVVNITSTQFEKAFGHGENGEMVLYDEITEWLVLHDFKVQYMDAYFFYTLGFENEDHWFMFKVRWL